MRPVANRRFEHALLIACIAFIAPPSVAHIVWVDSLAEIYRETDMLAAIYIDDAEAEFSFGRECGTRYRATIVRAFKSEPQDGGAAQLRFGHRSGLKSGKQYLVMLRHYADADKIYDTYHDVDWPGALWVIPKDLPKAAALEFIRCNGLLPGLDYDGAWEISDKAVIMESPLPSSWPPSIGKEREAPDSGTWLVSKDDLFAYLDSLR